MEFVFVGGTKEIVIEGIKNFVKELKLSLKNGDFRFLYLNSLLLKFVVRIWNCIKCIEVGLGSFKKFFITEVS